MKNIEVKDAVSKYVPEKINPNALLFNIEMTIGVTKQYLDDHPDTKQRVMNLLDNDKKNETR